jgi:hypothetical protein
VPLDKNPLFVFVCLFELIHTIKSYHDDRIIETFEYD